MSFLKTLATLAVGFAAAKGYDSFRKTGGMTGMQDRLKTAGAPGGLADTLGAMAEKMGIPGATETARGLFGSVGGAAASGTEAMQSGLGSLMSALTGAGAAGAGAMGGMLSGLTDGTPAGALLEDQARLMIRAMIEAAKADGAIDAEEQARLSEHLKDLDADQQAYVRDLMAAPRDLPGLVAATDAALRAQVYSASLMAIRLDSPAERAYLAQLATALALDDAARDGLHVAMGLAPVSV